MAQEPFDTVDETVEHIDSITFSNNDGGVVRDNSDSQYTHAVAIPHTDVVRITAIPNVIDYKLAIGDSLLYMTIVSKSDLLSVAHFGEFNSDDDAMRYFERHNLDNKDIVVNRDTKRYGFLEPSWSDEYTTIWVDADNWESIEQAE
jgi:hypothetical protein